MRKDGKEGRNKFAEDIKNGYTENDMEIDEDDADEDISESDIVVDDDNNDNDDKNDDNVSDDSVATTAMSATVTAMIAMTAIESDDSVLQRRLFQQQILLWQKTDQAPAVCIY